METDALSTVGGPSPLFVYAPREPKSLLQAIALAGWQPHYERRKSQIETAFLATGARVALVDARNHVEAGLDAVRMLADAVEVNAAALLLLIGEGEEAVLDHAVDLGITHWVSASGGEAAVLQALRLADRHSRRLSGQFARAAIRGEPAGRDALTGVGDAATARRWVEARLKAKRPLSLLLLAITRFEIINTAFGREVGDNILASVARLIGPLVAEAGGRQGLVARTSGAEFVIGIEGQQAEERLRLLAEQLVEQVERPVLSGTHLVNLSSRVVVVTAGGDDRDASALLRRASAALADAKASDQARIRVLSGDAPATEVRNESLKADLRGALDRGEIAVLFQPQVSIATGKITGVEALARWHHPTLGPLGAATLFAAAERSDYIVPLSAHIQQSALEAASRWPPALSGLRLALNITAADIAGPGFADAFLALVDRSGFPRGRLTVEVTESGLIEDLGAASTLLAQLRAGGCRVAIDDFGTGYSSLAYLKMLPLDYLKIDKQMAQDICGSPRDRIVVRGVIDMARSLGLAVVAEGVETEEQLTLLAREGCNYYQGFLCSEPVDADALAALIRA